MKTTSDRNFFDMSDKPRRFANTLFVVCGSHLLFCVYLLVASVALAEPACASNEKKETIIEILREISRTSSGPESGKGIAKVIISSGGIDVLTPYAKGKDLLVDFRFMGDLSRSDSYAISDGNKGNLLARWSLSPRRDIKYIPEHGGEVYLTNKSLAPLSNLMGFDFRPSTFQSVWGHSLNKRANGVLNNIEKDRGDYSMEINDDGTIEIAYAHRHNDPKEASKTKFKINTSRGYHLISYEGWHKKPDGFSRWYKQEVEWKEYGSEMYISEASFDGRWTRPDSSDIQEKGNTLKVKVEILDFEPNAKIDVTEFEIGAMEIPLGARMEDSITGLTYKYGGEIVAEKELAKTLEESELYQKNLSKTASSLSVDARNEKTSDKEDEMPDTTHEATGSYVGYLWFLIGGAFLVAVIGFVIYRRGRGKRA